MVESLKSIIEETNTKTGKAFDLFIQGLIVLSLVSFSVETLPNLSERALIILNWIETGCVVLFTLEYILRIVVSSERLKFVWSFYGLIDLFAILPFYLSTGVDLRGIRAFRLLRLFRIFKLVRYNKAIQRFQRAFIIVKEELILFSSMSSIILFLSAVGIYYFEREAQPEVYQSIFHSLWWAITSLTTVGYGDMYPITLGGRIFTFLVLVVGLGVVSIPAGLVASALSKAREMEQE